MLYQIRLKLHYVYAAPVHGGRHVARVLPMSCPAVQHVAQASVAISPEPAERDDFSDFFGNRATSFALRDRHKTLDVFMTASVDVSRPDWGADRSPDLAGLRGQLRECWSLASASPHHFCAGSPLAGIDPPLTTYGAETAGEGLSTMAIAERLCHRVHDDFTYDGDATSVATDAREAFALKRGVCQDFSHVMISALRGIGIPAAYVSGFIRTLPPPGKKRLEGADAMHAWVRVWCGRETGWREFDPTNRMRAGNDHITVGYGRDYGDVSPIVGMLRTSGGHDAHQSVDVIALE